MMEEEVYCGYEGEHSRGRDRNIWDSFCAGSCEGGRGEPDQEAMKVKGQIIYREGQLEEGQPDPWDREV